MYGTKKRSAFIHCSGFIQFRQVLLLRASPPFPGHTCGVCGHGGGRRSVRWFASATRTSPRMMLASLLLSSACWAAGSGSATGSGSAPPAPPPIIVIEQNVDTDYDCCNLYNASHPVFPGGAPGRPDTAPADSLTKCIEICSSLFHATPP